MEGARLEEPFLLDARAVVERRQQQKKSRWQRFEMGVEKQMGMREVWGRLEGKVATKCFLNK